MFSAISAYLSEAADSIKSGLYFHSGAFDVNHRVVFRCVLALAGVSILSAITWAQGFEVSGFGGGMTMDSGIGSHPSYGGAAAARLGDKIHIFGEYSRATLLTETVSSVTASGKLANYGGGADYSFGSLRSKVRPYVMAALGVGHFYVTGDGISSTVTNALYSEVGGGVRLYLGKHWGIKPGIQYRHYNSSNSGLVGGNVGSSNAVQYTAGVFFGR